MSPVALALAVVLLLPAAAVHGQALGGDLCLTDDPPAPDTPPRPVRFGITPLAAGSAGVAQADPVPHEPDQDLAALAVLRPGGRELVLRLNRMFWADGEEALQRYAALVDRYAAAGFRSELQVRYHPPGGAEGDMAAWAAYVRRAVQVLGPRPALSALSITNEANFSVSPNTSDGSYAGVREAIVVGIVAARDELDRMGRQDVELGFSFAWRWLPNQDRGFWQELGQRATPEFLAAIDHVGLQVYPGLVWPPVRRPGVSAGGEVAEALTLLRRCFMPQAGLGDEVDLWVSENGYPTNLLIHTEEAQDASLRSTVETVHALSGTLNITDYRWFNLRDNRSEGADLFDAVGLLRDDGTRKPAFGTFRDLLAVHGTPAVAMEDPAPADPATPPPPDPATPPPADGTRPAPGVLPATGGGGATSLPGVVALVVIAAARRRSLVGR